MNNQKMDRRIVKYFLLAAALVLGLLKFDVLLGFVLHLWKVIFPLALGAVIAYVLNIVMKKLEKLYFPKSRKKIVEKSRRMVCILLSILLVVLLIFLIFELVIPELVRALTVIASGIPKAVKMLQQYAEENSSQLPMVEEWLKNIDLNKQFNASTVAGYISSAASGIVGSTLSIVGTVGTTIMNFVIGLIFAIYILAGKEKLKTQFVRIGRAYIKPKIRAVIKEVLVVANETFSSFIVGQCTEAVILGTLCIVCMAVLRFPYAPMVGTFIGATALIPVVGAYLGAVVGFIMILTVSPLKALLFILFIVILQQVEGNLIYPRVVGSSIGLPGMWVLAAVTVGGSMFGVIGMLVGVPVAATAYKLIRKNIDQREAQKSIQAENMIEKQKEK